uniref:Protein phosphatase n=1 Tax=Globodera pallida TaxID=36090 RepID=A0A183BVK8_GLOPA
MLKLTRIFFTAIPTSSDLVGSRITTSKQWRHQQQLRLCSTNPPSVGPASPLNCPPSVGALRDDQQNEEEDNNKQQRPLVNLARSGIAKEFSGTTAEFFEQQRQAGHNVFGDDACFIASHKSTYVAGVADGVGGWRRHGIDPSKFSSQLMKNCAEIVQSGIFLTDRPDLIISRAFTRLKIRPRSSTACVLVIHERTLYAANLGDSGYLIYREGKVVFRSPEQTHYFNAPYQLTVLPERFKSPTYKGKAEYIGDPPENTDLRQHKLNAGDLVLIASDGLWDNVPEDKIADLLHGIEPNEASLQARCNTLALVARHFAADEHYDSPFALRAKLHGISAPGGKPDDVTIVLFHVA